MDFLRRYQTEFALLGAIVVFGINYPVLKVLTNELATFPLNALRFTVSALVMGTLLRGRLLQSFRDFRDNALELSLLALVGYLLSPVFLVLGLRYSSAANAALILAGAPVWTALLSWFLGNDRIGLEGWAGLFVSTVGLVIVTVPLGGFGESTEATVYGNLLLFGDSILWGSYVSLQKNLLDNIQPLQASFWSLLVVIPFFFAGSYGSLSVDLTADLSFGTWAGLLFSGVFAMGLGHLWWNVSLRSFGPTTVSVYGNGIPLVAVLVGWSILGESLLFQHVAGGLVILGGVWLARQDRIRKGRTELGVPET